MNVNRMFHIPFKEFRPLSQYFLSIGFVASKFKRHLSYETDSLKQLKKKENDCIGG